MATKQYDFLIIGVGIAGLTYALKLSEHYKSTDKKILIITKACLH
jgi:aspartate oxidase